MRIIIAIDIIDGKCVRLSRGDYNTKKIYNENPIETAKKIEDQGIKYLHLVDLDGAKSQHVTNIKILEKIASKTQLNIDFGGGIKTNSDIKSVFNAGAKQVVVGSTAVNNSILFSEWIDNYGVEKIILGADCIKRKIAINGWVNTSKYDVINFIKNFNIKNNIKKVICTDISKDGMLKGPSHKLYQEILSKVSIDLIASGGVTNIKEIKKLKKIGCEGVIIGKALYEKKISLKKLVNIF